MRPVPSRPSLRRRPVGVLAAVALAASGLALAVPTAAAAEPVTTAAPAASVDPTSRASVLRAYQNIWVPADRTAIGWTGTTSPCNAGTNSAASQAATLRAVNFARSLAGRRPVTMDATLSAAALQAALISQATGTLNHAPSPSAACYTAAGAAAAGKSNLYGIAGTPISAATPIESYLTDPGAGNNVAGHRRWLLFSRLAKIGSGSTTGANALYVIDSASFRPSPVGSKVAAWPSAGYFPSALEPGGRWSISVPGADFSAAKVVVTKGGTRLPTTVTSRTDNGYGDNTLVWSVDPRYDIGQGDQAYRVSVTGYTVAGVATNTRYTTTLFDATVGLADRNVIGFPWPGTKPVGVTFDPHATNNNGLTVYYVSNTPGVCRVNSGSPSTVTTLTPGSCSVMAYTGSDPRWPDAPYQTRSFTVKA